MVEIRQKINRENLLKAVDEYQQGNRTLILDGSFHENQGFTLFPVENDMVDIHVDGKGISRKISIEEARQLKDSPHCINKEAISAFLEEIQKSWSNLFENIRRKVLVDTVKDFDPHEFYRDTNPEVPLSVVMRFQERVLAHAKSVSNLPSTSYRTGCLEKSPSFKRIMKEFHVEAEDVSEALAHIALMLMKQKRGQIGELFNNGCANAFYVNVNGSIFELSVWWWSNSCWRIIEHSVKNHFFQGSIPRQVFARN